MQFQFCASCPSWCCQRFLLIGGLSGQQAPEAPCSRKPLWTTTFHPFILPLEKNKKIKNQMLNCQAAVRGWRAISCTYLFIYWWKVGALVKTKAKKNTQLCVRNKGHCLCSSQVCSPRAVNILSLPPWLWDLLQKLGTFPAPSCTKDSWPILHLGHLSFISVSHKALSRFILFNGPLFFFFSWFYCHRKFSLFYYLFPVGTGLKIKWINKYICIHIKTCRQESHSDLERPW